jgi:hypothetical protein
MIASLPGTKFLQFVVRVQWSIVRRLVWNSNLQGALVADEVVLRRMFTLWVAAMICQLLDEKIHVGLPLYILCRNPLDKWFNLRLNNYLYIKGTDPEWSPGQIVLGTGPGNLPTVRVWTANTGRIDSRPIPKPDQLPLGRPNLDPCLSTHRFCQVLRDVSVPISCFGFWVSLFIITFKYATFKCLILTLVYSLLFWMYWPPWWSTSTETRALPHPENECQQSFNNCWLCIMGNLEGDIFHVVRIIVLAIISDIRETWTIPSTTWKWASTERRRVLLLLLR